MEWKWNVSNSKYAVKLALEATTYAVTVVD